MQLNLREYFLYRRRKLLFSLGKRTYRGKWYATSANLFSSYARTIDMNILLEEDERFVLDEQIRRHIDKCFDDFHTKGQGIPPFCEQYSYKRKRPVESYRDVKLCLLAPQFINNDERYIENEYEDYFIKTALKVGIQAEMFYTDLISYPNLPQDTSIAQKRLQELREYIAKTRPHIILVDANYIGNQDTVNPYLLNEFRQTTGAKIVGFIGDAYGDLGRKMADYWAEQCDLLLHSAPGDPSALCDPFAEKMVLIPIPINRSRFYRERNQRFDISFMGTYESALRPFWLSHVMKIATQQSMTTCVIPHSRGADECPDMEEYAKILRHSRIVINFSSRTPTDKDPSQRVLTGRVWQTLASGCLLFEEENEPIRTFFTPFVHYIPFANISQLKALLIFLHTHEDYRKRIADAGFEWCNTWYSIECIWSYIFANLGFPKTFG